MKHHLLVRTPNRVIVYLIPDLMSTRVACIYHHAEPDQFASNTAARYIIAEGWISYAAGTLELTEDVNQLILSV